MKSMLRTVIAFLSVAAALVAQATNSPSPASVVAASGQESSPPTAAPPVSPGPAATLPPVAAAPHAPGQAPEPADSQAKPAKAPPKGKASKDSGPVQDDEDWKKPYVIG